MAATMRRIPWRNGNDDELLSPGGPRDMNRGTHAGVHTHPRRFGRPPTPPQRLPRVRRTELPTVKLPRQSRTGGGKSKLTNHRAARILHAIGCGCYRETAAELAGVTRETLANWMRWDGEPYLTFQ